MRQPLARDEIEVGQIIRLIDFGGDGPMSVLLVHGLGGAAENWLALAPALARLARVRAIDLPGVGLSPPSPTPPTVKSSRRGVASILDRLAPRPRVLVGSSFGGLVSPSAASSVPRSTRVSPRSRSR